MGILSLILASLLSGNIFFKSLPLEDAGLNVSTICQDRMGIMWFGGIEGLTRYDGRHYSHFRSRNKYDPDSHVKKLICDADGNVWAAHFGGLSRFDRETNTFINFPAPSGALSDVLQISPKKFLLISGRQLWLFDSDGQSYSRDGLPATLLSAKISSLAKDGNIISIGTSDGTVFQTSTSLGGECRELTSTQYQINCILPEKGGKLWLGTEGKGLWVYDGEIRQLEKDRSDFVRTLCLDRSGNLWIGTKNGLKIMEGDTVHEFHYDYYSPGSISHDSIVAIFMDGQGSMWMGTYYGGVCYYTTQSSQFSSIVSRPGKGNLSGNVISDIVEDQDGSLWIGTNSEGLNHMLPSGKFEHFGSEGDVPVDIKSIYISPRSGQIYIGADRSDLLLLDRKKKSLHPFGDEGCRSCYAIVDDLHGGFYAGGENGLFHYDEKTAFGARVYISEDVSNIKSMKLDSRGILWIGWKYGLTALQTGSGKVIGLPEQLLSLQYVEAILEDRSGKMWIGADNGLFSYNLASGEIESFSEDILPDRVIHGIEEDESGVLWVSTDNGLWRFDPSTGDKWTFTTADGLLDNRFTPYAHCLTRDGRLFFGSLHGIVSFDPKTITMHSETVAPVISGIEINGLLRGVPADNIVLKPNEKDISFSFSSPDYISLNNGRFFYKLEGMDESWHEADVDWLATYRSLRPGEYTFKLKYRNSSGVSSETEAHVHLKLLAPWYQTYAARLTGIILLLLVVLALFIWMLSRKDKEYKAEMNKVRSDLLRDFSLEFVKFGSNHTEGKESSVATSFNSSDEVFMRQAMKVVKENIDNPEFSIDDFASNMLMSRSNLNLRVRALFGVSPLDFIKTVRFNEACRLLLSGKHSVSEISYKVGFATPSYFTAAFRRFLGCTPSDYIRENGKKA